ncbi:RNA-binding domain-containing protein [Lonepinella sp. BR2271]|uniref:RNA-binding domain-containing protein n=1 Tax=Lonepinella sp. BR2271 TaxID=3434550 RepID=UPI003F6E2FF2
MNKTELLQKLTDIEWDDFEVKSAHNGLPENIWETVSAFSNGSGGWIVLGIEQKGKIYEIVGVSNAEKLEQNFTTVLRNRDKFSVLINPLCKKYHFDNKTVLAFFIPAAEQKPVYFNKLANTFIRTGSGDQRASKEEINALLRDQLFGVMSAKPALRTTLDDINRTTLGRYRDYMSRFNPALPYNTMPEDEFLQRLQIVDGEHLTYGGLLFLGKNIAINRNISDFRVDLLEIPGRSYAEAQPRYTFRLEEQENLWEYYFAIIERLKRYVDMPFKMNDLGIAVENSPQLEALREALVNMLMHTDYFSVAKPRVRIFSDRIEFENPGSFPLPIEELLKTDVSVPRNPVIAKLFRHVKLAENAGFGFDKILAWEGETHTKVNFDKSIAFSKVTFPLAKKFGDMEQTGDKSGASRGQDTDHVTVQVGTKSGPSQDQVGIKSDICLIDEQKCLLEQWQDEHSLLDLMSWVGRSNRTKFRQQILTPLLEQGIAEMTIPDKPNSRLQRYRLTDKGRALAVKIAGEK